MALLGARNRAVMGAIGTKKFVGYLDIYRTLGQCDLLKDLVCQRSLRRSRLQLQAGRALSSAPRAWQRHAKDCAALVGVLRPHSPVMPLDDRLHDRQTEAQPLRLRREE